MILNHKTHTCTHITCTLGTLVQNLVKCPGFPLAQYKCLMILNKHKGSIVSIDPDVFSLHNPYIFKTQNVYICN